MILTRIFDVIMDLGGEFEVMQMTVGKKKKEPSYAKLQIQGKTQDHLDKILEQVYREGATPTVDKNVVLKAAPKDMVMPEDFYFRKMDRSRQHDDGQVYSSQRK
jgi:hypothetical protein